MSCFKSLICHSTQCKIQNSNFIESGCRLLRRNYPIDSKNLMASVTLSISHLSHSHSITFVLLHFYTKTILLNNYFNGNNGIYYSLLRNSMFLKQKRFTIYMPRNLQIHAFYIAYFMLHFIV